MSGTAPGLDGLLLTSAAEDHGKSGFHHRHTCAPESLLAIARAFDAAGYFLEMMTAEDRRADLDKMRLVYTWNRFGPVDRHLLQCDLEVGASAPSVVAATAAADWMEREVYDMYGVTFDGHPDLKRILLPDDSDFHALLKDFGRMEDAEGASGNGHGEDA
ncbi:MAG: NADH-quinone oxidoreductase subunit C [Deltaproteobacteria bacterium]|nr:MAG: NADH-quinone oxidoreductase subunit C [Deltaproteobacteria bacterium]